LNPKTGQPTKTDLDTLVHSTVSLQLKVFSNNSESTPYSR